ncbi:MAG: SPOR domain-containing protein [Legionellales bacterium]|jgi:cell division septation protein DedD
MLSNLTFKHRLIGAIFLISLAVIIIPALLDTPKVDTLSSADSLPQAPLHAAWEELDKIEYSFTELAQNEEAQPVVELSPPTEEPVLETAVQAPVIEQALIEPANNPAPATAPEIKPELKAEPKPEPAVIASTEKLITHNTWAVQLGAFSKAANAQALVKRLEAKGYSAYLEEMSDLKLTRVLVGTEADKQQATELLTEIDKNMQLKGIIVKFNPKG